MKKLLIVLLVLFCAVSLWADNDGFSVGFEVGEIGPDLNFGGRVTSPWFFDGHVAVRLAADSAWKAEDNWRPYLDVRLGLLGSSGMLGDYIRLYGEGGGLMLWNEDGASSLVFGGYGLFGFEFFTGEDSPISYFIEAGTSGCSVSRLNGFDVRTGFSFYF